MLAIPLSLYIHFPWCLSKCPYCDFNSYVITDKKFITAYSDKLCIDLATEAKNHRGCKLISIYFGGGTPSLLSPETLVKILSEVRNNFFCPPEVEITLEANPGTIDLNLCQEFRHVGINRLSLGIQSFNDKSLKDIQRIHNAQEAIAAVKAVKASGFSNFNLDIMFGLPGQNVASAITDLSEALSFSPPHLSWYQMTVDGNFGSRAPAVKLPDDEDLWNIQQAGQEFLAKNNYQQYEVAAYSCLPKYRCQHNMNYWQYGDYIGVGAGAHGKTIASNYDVRRYAKISNPYEYLQATNLVASQEIVPREKIPLEFMLNALRLYQPISYDLFQSRTGVKIGVLDQQLQEAKNLGLIVVQNGAITTTEHGKNFLNDLLEVFL